MIGAELLKSRSIAIQQLIDVQKNLCAFDDRLFKRLDPKTREELVRLAEGWMARRNELIDWLRENP